MAFKLGTSSIYELGKLVSDKLEKDGVTTPCELTIYVSNEEFKKVDEDLYYRNKTDDSQEFIPSEGEIIVKIDNVQVLIKVKK